MGGADKVARQVHHKRDCCEFMNFFSIVTAAVMHGCRTEITLAIGPKLAKLEKSDGVT